MIRCHCPHCQEELGFDAGLSGTVARCPSCGGMLTYPDPPLVRPPVASLARRRGKEDRDQANNASLLRTIVYVLLVILLVLAFPCVAAVVMQMTARPFAD
jgi:hypothetical protein